MSKKHNLSILSSVQRLWNILITGELPSTPGAALDIINGIIPIDLVIEEEAAKGALRLKSNNHWIYEPMVNKKGNLTTQLLKAINLNSEEQDQQSTYYITKCWHWFHHRNSSTLRVWGNRERHQHHLLQCYTDGSKMNEKVGAGVYIVVNDTPPREESYHLGIYRPPGRDLCRRHSGKIVRESGTKTRKIIINCDSQATITLNNGNEQHQSQI